MRSLPVLLLLLLLAVRAAHAGVPNLGNCTVPTWIASSPDGALMYQLVVRDAGNQPVAGSTVQIEFQHCTLFAPCTVGCTTCTVDAPSQLIRADADANGVARFDLRLRADGCPVPIEAKVYADMVWIGNIISYASLDQDGDGSVTAADLAIVKSRLGWSDTRSNFDGDPLVTSADVAILQAHLGATCELATPVLPHTWGRLKSAYR